MRVEVNSHALPFLKKSRIISLLCIFETAVIVFIIIIIIIIIIINIIIIKA